MIPVVELHQVSKSYRLGPQEVPALKEVSLRIDPGEFVAITGASGSGKTTLLNLLGLLDRPDEGTYTLDGREVASFSDDELTLLRNRQIGFVFQHAPMLPRFSVEANVAVPLLYRGVTFPEALLAAKLMLGRLGLADVADRKPAQLSGGQLRRVGVARALVGKPRLILADEPTAALDEEAVEDVLTLLLEAHRESETALVLITHDRAAAARAGRQLVLAAGRLHEEVRP